MPRIATDLSRQANKTRHELAELERKRADRRITAEALSTASAHELARELGLPEGATLIICRRGRS